MDGWMTERGEGGRKGGEKERRKEGVMEHQLLLPNIAPPFVGLVFIEGLAIQIAICSPLVFYPSPIHNLLSTYLQNSLNK